MDYLDVRKARIIDPQSEKVQRQSKVSLSDKAKCQTRRGRSRESPRVDRRDCGSRLASPAASRRLAETTWIRALESTHHKPLMMHEFTRV